MNISAYVSLGLCMLPRFRSGNPGFGPLVATNGGKVLKNAMRKCYFVFSPPCVFLDPPNRLISNRIIYYERCFRNLRFYNYDETSGVLHSTGAISSSTLGGLLTRYLFIGNGGMRILKLPESFGLSQYSYYK